MFMISINPTFGGLFTEAADERVEVEIAAAPHAGLWLIFLGVFLPGIKSIKDMDVLGVAVIVLSNDGEILIGSDGLDQNTCQRLFQQSATIMAEEAGLGPTVH